MHRLETAFLLGLYSLADAGRHRIGAGLSGRWDPQMANHVSLILPRIMRSEQARAVATYGGRPRRKVLLTADGK